VTKRKSALVVTVKPTLIDWVRKQGIRRPYIPEEDCVWLIPTTSAFAPDEFDVYVDAIKDAILDAELQRFDLDLRERILRDHTFDELIQLSVRDDVVMGPEIPERKTSD
jgi:hypothetical protein